MARILSVLVAAWCLGCAFHHDGGLLMPLLSCALALVLIWFPRDVDEYTLGLWYAGYRIENRTPVFLIATFGWLVLAGILYQLCFR